MNSNLKIHINRLISYTIYTIYIKINSIYIEVLNETRSYFFFYFTSNVYQLTYYIQLLNRKLLNSGENLCIYFCRDGKDF